MGKSITDLWECPRCEIDSTGKQMCPCPLGKCEAELVGSVITNVLVKNYKPGDQFFRVTEYSDGGPNDKGIFLGIFAGVDEETIRKQRNWESGHWDFTHQL